MTDPIQECCVLVLMPRASCLLKRGWRRAFDRWDWPIIPEITACCLVQRGGVQVRRRICGGQIGKRVGRGLLVFGGRGNHGWKVSWKRMWLESIWSMIEDLEGAHLIGGIPRLKGGKERRLLGKRIDSGELMMVVIREMGL